MTKKDFIRKITSRKFMVAAITLVAGIVTMFGINQTIVQTISGALMIILPTVVYCITEGKIDAASVKTIGDAVADTVEQLGGSEEAAEAIKDMTDDDDETDE